MHGKKDKSTIQRITLTLIHFISVLVCAWILFGSGSREVFRLFGESAIDTPSSSRLIILGCSTIYFARLCFTTFVLLKRKMEWNEVIEVATLLTFTHVYFTCLTIFHKEQFYTSDWLLILLFLVGSFLNTTSEWRRMIWKKDPQNKGKFYCAGLFKYSMHVNYFGDSVSFTGFALLTGSLWALITPVAMTLGFVFIHIPKLDQYLQEKYGQEFDQCAKHTKKFIPGIY